MVTKLEDQVFYSIMFIFYFDLVTLIIMLCYVCYDELEISVFYCVLLKREPCQRRWNMRCQSHIANRYCYSGLR